MKRILISIAVCMVLAGIANAADPNDIVLIYPSGTIYGVIYQGSLVWNPGTNALVAYNSANMADYDVAAVSKGASRYVWDADADLTEGVYDVVLYLQAGASPASTDVAISNPTVLHWNGTEHVTDVPQTGDTYAIFPSLATGTVGTAGTASSCTLSAAFSTVAGAYPRGVLVKFTDATTGLSYVSRVSGYTTGRMLTVIPPFPVAPENGDAITLYAIVWPFFGF